MAEVSRLFDDDLVGLFDLSHDAFCIAGFDGYLKRANPAFARSLGYTVEELLARPFMDNVYPDDVESVEAILAELAAGSDIAGFDCREVCADGSVRWFEWSTSSRPEDRVVYGVARDVTDRRMANAELDALRRVATLAADGVAPSELFAIVAEEVARVVNVPLVVVARYELDGTVTQCASFPTDHLIPLGHSLFPVGKRWSLGGRNVVELVRTSGESARIDDYAKLDGELAAAARRIGLHSTVGIPIVVAGHLWGAIVVSAKEPDPLPQDTVARLASFTELLATAIANAESREALGRLADEQAALRRVATLVARGTPPSEVFAAVANEMARCLHAANVTVSSFEDDTVTIVAVAALAPGIQHAPRVGIRRTLADGDNIATRVFQTGRPARLEGLEFQNAPGVVAAWLRTTRLRSTVAVPIIVDGGVWGIAALGSLRPEPMPPDTEARMSDFADLVGTAITNAVTRAELIASRARIVAAADEGRRRLERDLHDGAQQRLVTLGLQTRLAEAAVPPEMHALKQQLCDIVSALTGVSADLQEISRGIHPAILSRGGLPPALKTLARRSAIPVALDLTIDQRLSDSVEVGAYYVVSEALTNAAKHSHATEVAVSGRTNHHTLSLSIRDDGVGGADMGNGSGLVGLADRVEALGGRMRIKSPAGQGTSLEVTIPLGGT